MGKSSPKAIDEALKDFGKIPASEKQKKDDAQLIEIAKSQKEELISKDRKPEALNTIVFIGSII